MEINLFKTRLLGPAGRLPARAVSAKTHGFFIQMTQSILAQGVISGCNSQIAVEFGQNYCAEFIIVQYNVVLTKLRVLC